MPITTDPNDVTYALQSSFNLYREIKKQQPSKQKRRTDFQMPTWEQILHYELQERSYVIYEHWHKKADLHQKAGNILTCI